MGQSVRDFGVSLEVFELRDDVGADERDVKSARIAGGNARREKLPGGLDVAEPFGGERQAAEVAAHGGIAGIGRQNGFDGSAVGVAADDDVADAENFDCVFDGRGNAASHGALRRNDVAGGAAEEHVAGLGLEDEVGDDARVGAGNEEDVGLLDVGEEVEVVLHAGEDIAAEAGVALEKMFHGRRVGRFSV